jgi:hypothetical protein
MSIEGMSRNAVHIVVASLTFSAGFLMAGEFEGFIEALPLALCVFVLTKHLPDFRLGVPRGLDSHKVKVAVVTLLLWIPVLMFYLPLLIQQGGGGLGHCTLDVP